MTEQVIIKDSTNLELAMSKSIEKIDGKSSCFEKGQEKQHLSISESHGATQSDHSDGEENIPLNSASKKIRKTSKKKSSSKKSQLPVLNGFSLVERLFQSSNKASVRSKVEGKDEVEENFTSYQFEKISPVEKDLNQIIKDIMPRTEKVIVKSPYAEQKMSQMFKDVEPNEPNMKEQEIFKTPSVRKTNDMIEEENQLDLKHAEQQSAMLDALKSLKIPILVQNETAEIQIPTDMDLSKISNLIQSLQTDPSNQMISEEISQTPKVPRFDPHEILTVPLNHLKEKIHQDEDVVTNFFDRGANINNVKDASAIIQTVTYSNRLGLEEYVNQEETPLTKKYKECLSEASQVQTGLSNAIEQFKASVIHAKQMFFENRKKTQAKLSDVMIEEEKALQEFIANSGSKSDRLSSDGAGEQFKCSEIPEATFLDMVAKYKKGLAFKIENLHELLKQHFGIESLEENEMNCVRSLARNRSVIYRVQKAHNKQLVYQVSSLISTGLVLYVNQSINYMTDQIKNLRPSLSGACLNCLLTQEKSSQIYSLINSNGIKILYITPDKLTSENPSLFKNVSLICIDEAQCIPKISSNYKSQYACVKDYIQANFSQIPNLMFVSPTTPEVMKALEDTFLVEEYDLYPDQYTNTAIYDFTISRDEDKPKGLVNYLRRIRANPVGPTVIYSDSKRSVEEVSNLCIQNGFKVYNLINCKNEVQKLDQINSFLRNSGSLLAVQSNSETGIIKSWIRSVIHYNLPRSLENYIQEISFLNEKAVCHLFLNEEDYLRLRLQIEIELIDLHQIKRFHERVWEIRDECREKWKVNSNRKRLSQDGVPLLGLAIKSREDQIQSSEMDAEFISGISQIKVTDFCQELDLKREQILEVFEINKQVDNKWLELCGIYPVNYEIHFIFNPETFMENNSVIKQILERGRKQQNNCFKFNLIDLANYAKSSVSDIQKSIKQIQNDGILQIDSLSDESICFKVHCDILNESLDCEYEQIHKIINYKTILEINKLDLMYAVAKSCSFQSIEHLWKQVIEKYLQERFRIKLMSDASETNSAQKRQKSSLIDYFEKYLNYQSSNLDYKYQQTGEVYKGYEAIFENENSKLRDHLPLIRLNTLKDKNNIITDIMPLLGEFQEELKDLDSKLPYDSYSRSVLTRNIVRILLGQPSQTGKEYKSNKFWDKYYRADYRELFDIVYEGLFNFNNIRTVKKKQ